MNPVTIKSLIQQLNELIAVSPLGENTCVYLNVADNVDYTTPVLKLEIDPDGAILLINPPGFWEDYPQMPQSDTNHPITKTQILCDDCPMTEIQLLERQVITKFLTDAIAKGYQITVDDGDGTVIEKSTNVQDIMKEMFSVDQEHLYLYKDGVKVGWVLLIYGEDGWDVIADYSISLEPLMQETNKLIDKLSG